MPFFRFHLQRERSAGRPSFEPDDLLLDLRDVHHAYLEACKAIPDEARDLLIRGEDPLRWSYAIYDQKGTHLMGVPFSDVLSPASWRLQRARRRPHSSTRSKQSRDDLALIGFRTMFSTINIGCVLLTPELEVREINDFGARYGQVDCNAIYDQCLLDVFGVTGEPKIDFHRFLLLARAGETSEFLSFPYVTLDQHSQTVNGWWNGRAWPIFDDDHNLLAIAQCAQPYMEPTAHGSTLVRVVPDLLR